MEVVSIDKVRKISTFLNEMSTRNEIVRYAGPEFTEAIINMNRIVSNSYDMGQMGKSIGFGAFSTIKNAEMWIGSLE